MTLQEFAKLKVGDQIDNPMTNSRGTVTDVLADGIKLRWGAEPQMFAYTYTAQSTAWFHWSKVENDETT